MGEVVFLSSKKAQVSMEYMAVIGLSLLFLMPLLVVFVEQSKGLEEEINIVQSEKLALIIIDTAEEVFYLGAPSQKLLELYFPPNIDSVSIESQAVVFSLTDNFTFPAESSLPLNITGSINNHVGLHRILVAATDNGITISDIS